MYLFINTSYKKRMPKIFASIDKLKPFYDMAYKIVMLLCKILLVIDIGVTCMQVAGRYISFIPDPSWSEEVILTCMAYMAVLSASLAIRKGTHIRMSALDKYLPKKILKVLDLLADLSILALALVMIFIGFSYAKQLGSLSTYVSMPFLSRFWMYFPVPVAGVAMLIFEFEAIYNHIKAFFINEPKKEVLENDN